MGRDLHVFYRFSDGSQSAPDGTQVSKAKPAYVTKRNCLVNFLAAFGLDNLVVVADNVKTETMQWLISIVGRDRLVETRYGNGAHTFLHAANMAAQLHDDAAVYLVEDDFVHTHDAKRILLEGLDIGDYVTGYDHKDKYINTGEVYKGAVGNPLISENSEETRVHLTKSCHWKETNSTVLTFLTRAKAVKQDFEVYKKFCSGLYPFDHQIFRELITVKNRKLVSTIPGKCTHGETAYLSPLVDWPSVMAVSLSMYDQQKFSS